MGESAYPSCLRAAGAAARNWPASPCSPRAACAFSSSGGWGGGTELACQSLLTVLLNFGFLVFGVTDYASELTTAHYGAITAREPHEEGAQAACRLLGKRLAEWVAVFYDGRKDEHPLNKPDVRLPPG